MAKYDNMHENIGEIMVSGLYATVQDEYIVSNELFKRKLINKFNELYNLAIDESLKELKEAIDAIESLKAK